MSRRQDTRTPRQRFTALVQAELDVRMGEDLWTVSKFIKESGVGRATIYEWLKTDSDRMPKVEKVQLYAANLGIPYEPYAEALGWTESEASPPRDNAARIERTKRIAAHEGTSPERRRVLEARIAAAESALREAQKLEEAIEEILRGVDEPEDVNDQ